MKKKETLTRAEAVRQRRATQKKPRKQRSPIAAPSAPARSKNLRTRRYESATLNPAREGLRPITMPAFQWNWRIASALLAILLSISIYFAFASAYFKVAAPTISGSQRLSVGEIASTLQLNGKSIFLLTPRAIERDLQLTFPSLSSVSVHVKLPNQVYVNVTEREPLIAWHQQEGGMAWIDAEGIAFPVHGQVDGLVTITALGSPPAPLMDTATRNELAPPPFIAPEIVSALQALAPHAPQGTPIIYDPQYGLGWNDPRGWTVRFGDITDEIALKLRIYETMVAWFAENNTHPILVSVVQPHAPFYRTEP